MEMWVSALARAPQIASRQRIQVERVVPNALIALCTQTTNQRLGDKPLHLRRWDQRGHAASLTHFIGNFGLPREGISDAVADGRQIHADGEGFQGRSAVSAETGDWIQVYQGSPEATGETGEKVTLIGRWSALSLTR